MVDFYFYDISIKVRIQDVNSRGAKPVREIIGMSENKYPIWYYTKLKIAFNLGWLELPCKIFRDEQDDYIIPGNIAEEYGLGFHTIWNEYGMTLYTLSMEQLPETDEVAFDLGGPRIMLSW